MEYRPETSPDRQSTEELPLRFRKRAWDRYATETAGIFNRYLSISSGRVPSASEAEVDFVDGLVAPEVIDQRVAGLHRMECATRRWRFEQPAQLHEAMTCAPRIERVEGDRITLVPLEF